MLPATRLLIQVVPKLTLGRCGVSDQAALLARELKEEFGIESAFVILNSNEKCELPYRTVSCLPSQLLESCLALTEGQAGAMLVHLSGYGYSADGAPTLLANTLEGVKASGQFRMAVYFHELYASGMPWRKAFWFSSRQRRALRKITEQGDLLAASIRQSADWLEQARKTKGLLPVQYLPVFSAAGEARTLPRFESREAVIAVFGLAANRQRAYKKSPLEGMLPALGVKEIYDIGPEFDVPSKLNGVPVRRMGILTNEELACLFPNLMFGYVPHLPIGVAKSSIFASFCANGVVPVLMHASAGTVDGLRDGEQFISPRTIEAVKARGLQHCSMAAWEWYSKHSLRIHASTYHDWMRSMDFEHAMLPTRAD